MNSSRARKPIASWWWVAGRSTRRSRITGSLIGSSPDNPPSCQPVEREAHHVVQELDELRRAEFGGRLSLLRGGERRIARRTRRMQILGDPAKRGMAGWTQQLEFVRNADCRRRKIIGLVHVHQVGPEMQHQRRLDIARMDSDRELLVGIEA